VAAHNDAAGVTEAFNKNLLHVLNRELGAASIPGSSSTGRSRMPGGSA
jgi:L-histidine N-alpha-methyltransferase